MFDKIKKMAIFNILFLLLILGVVVDLILNVYFNVSILQFTLTDSSANWKTNWTIRGQWGDSLSGHFSALAFMAVAYSIYLQRKDIKQEREHENFKLILELTRGLNDREQYIRSINFSTAHPKLPHGREFVDIEDLSNALIYENELSGYSFETTDLTYQIAQKLSLYYITVETAKILLDDNTNEKFVNAINKRIQHHKTIFSSLLRIFLFAYKHIGDAFYTMIIERSQDETYKHLLVTAKKIMDNESISIEDKLITFLNILLHEDLKL